MHNFGRVGSFAGRYGYGEDLLHVDKDRAGGFHLTEVAEGSPAMNAGLQKGDIIISMNGEDVHYCTTLSRILLEEEAGTEIGITLMRPSGEGYTEMELTVVLE